MKPADWPAVENPPKQGEGATLVAGTAIYSVRALSRTVREPQNTWSSLAFVLAAGWLCRRWHDTLTRGLGVALVAVAVGSTLFHASGTRELRHLDIAGLYWTYLAVATLAARRVAGEWISGLLDRRPIVASAGLAALALGLTSARNLRVFTFKPLHVSVTTSAVAVWTSLALLVICVHRAERVGWMLAASALVAFLVGLALQVGDRPGNFCCLPGAWIQPHALWHVLSALAVVLAVECLERTHAPCGNAIAAPAARR